MAGTYVQINIQIVFAVKYRQKILQKPWRNEVFKYMAGIIENKGQKSIIVNGVEDHVHLLIGLRPSIAISDLVRDIKNNSSKFINQHNWTKQKFAWQGGYGAFSYSQSQINSVYNYIYNQEEHHRRKTFNKEYHSLLSKYEISFDERYIFDNPE